MAATSLWHIEGRLKDLISYVENPEKTVPNKEMQDFFDVFSYVKNPQKTDNGEFVSAINCLKETALQQMILTKKQYQKTGGYIAWHGYQSFKPDEVTPEQCHEIGLKLAREMWGDKYQIIVVTHLDRGHLHNHFCFNSVSYLDGSKYNYSKSEQKRLRETSDRLCREYGLSVIENPKKAPSRPLYLDEKSGKPTRYNVYLEDLAEAISGSRDIPHMMKYLIDKGYEVDFSGGHWKMKLPQYKHFTRLDTLDERLTPDFIRSHLGTRARYGNYKAKISYSPHMPEEYKKAWKPHQKTRGILALYYYWCYQLGIFPKGTDYKPTSPLMKEELRKLDEITTQVRYMSEHNISTLSDLHADREKNQTEMDRLTNYRRHLQNKIRRASPAEKETLREEKNGVTERITELRKRLKYADGIEKRSAHQKEENREKEPQCHGYATSERTANHFSRRHRSLDRRGLAGRPCMQQRRDCSRTELRRRSTFSQAEKAAAGEHRKTVDRGAGSRAVPFVRRGHEEERPLRTLWPHARRNRVPPAAAGENVKNVAPQATKPSFGCATMRAQSNEGGFSL